jgi:hypothetical protein
MTAGMDSMTSSDNAVGGSQSFTCAICAQTVPEDDGRLRLVEVSRLADVATQLFYVHASCLAKCLHPSIPLGEVFDS